VAPEPPAAPEAPTTPEEHAELHERLKPKEPKATKPMLAAPPKAKAKPSNAVPEPGSLPKGPPMPKAAVTEGRPVGTLKVAGGEFDGLEVTTVRQPSNLTLVVSTVAGEELTFTRRARSGGFWVQKGMSPVEGGVLTSV
jgi:hypothetical protein